MSGQAAPAAVEQVREATQAELAVSERVSTMARLDGILTVPRRLRTRKRLLCFAMHSTSKPAELVTALRESAWDPYCGTPLGVEAAWCPNGIDVPLVDRLVTAVESLPAAAEPVPWFLAGAALLDGDPSGRRGVDLPLR